MNLFLWWAVAALPLVALAVLPGMGSRRRGNSAAGVAVQAVCFPMAWIAWYIKDEKSGPEAGSTTDARAR